MHWIFSCVFLFAFCHETFGFAIFRSCFGGISSKCDPDIFAGLAKQMPSVKSLGAAYEGAELRRILIDWGKDQVTLDYSRPVSVDRPRHFLLNNEDASALILDHRLQDAHPGQWKVTQGIKSHELFDGSTKLLHWPPRQRFGQGLRRPWQQDTETSPPILPIATMKDFYKVFLSHSHKKSQGYEKLQGYDSMNGRPAPLSFLQKGNMALANHEVLVFQPAPGSPCSRYLTDQPYYVAVVKAAAVPVKETEARPFQGEIFVGLDGSTVANWDMTSGGVPDCKAPWFKRPHRQMSTIEEGPEDEFGSTGATELQPMARAKPN